MVERIKTMYCYRLDLFFLVIHSLILTTIAKELLAKGALIIKDSSTNNETTNELLPHQNVLNRTVIKDNTLNKVPGTTHKMELYTPTTVINSSTIILNDTEHRQDNASSISLLSRKRITTGRPTQFQNFTTIIPPHSKANHSHKYKILQYILIPVGCILLIIALLCVVRHIQRVKKKRRLERELLHQYSYPNSEAGDIDEEERLLEVESVVNTQFNIADDQEEKNFVDEIPQVSVSIIGEGSKLVIQDSQSLTDEVEASTSFNC